VLGSALWLGIELRVRGGVRVTAGDRVRRISVGVMFGLALRLRLGLRLGLGLGLELGLGLGEGPGVGLGLGLV